MNAAVVSGGNDITQLHYKPQRARLLYPTQRWIQAQHSHYVPTTKTLLHMGTLSGVVLQSFSCLISLSSSKTLLLCAVHSSQM